jgi:hypothetical protein
MIPGNKATSAKSFAPPLALGKIGELETVVLPICWIKRCTCQETGISCC